MTRQLELQIGKKNTERPDLVDGDGCVLIPMRVDTKIITDVTSD